jgi:hypothetical protein
MFYKNKIARFILLIVCIKEALMRDFAACNFYFFLRFNRVLPYPN